MNEFEKAKLELDLSLIELRLESIANDVRDVEILKRDVMWCLNNKWLNLKRRMADLFKVKRELEVALGIDEAVVKEIRLKVSESKEGVYEGVSLVEAVDVWLSDLKGRMRVKSFVADRRRVSKGEDVFCSKCLKKVATGRWLYKSGNCAVCERNVVLRKEHLLVASGRKLDSEFRSVVKS